MTAVTEGDNITLTCDVTGIPSPTIEWREEGKNEVLGSGSNFTIHNALRVAGNAPLRYTCTASNGVESPAQAQVSVDVQCEYRFGSSRFASSNNRTAFNCLWIEPRLFSTRGVELRILLLEVQEQLNAQFKILNIMFENLHAWPRLAFTDR